MGGQGIELRMKILRDAANQQILKPLRTHGWDADIDEENASGEYLVIKAAKAGTTKKVALMYTSATANEHYKKLGKVVEHVFTNGALYHIESYAYGIHVPVTPIDDFFPLLLQWNKELAPAAAVPTCKRRAGSVRHITAEIPLESVWGRLNQFGSIHLAEKMIRRRTAEMSLQLSDTVVQSKAEGVAYAIRNASDYFRNAPFESLNKTILSLYYGVLALAFAELLASPDGPTDLDEVEGMTKQGHGLYTVSAGTGKLEELFVGVLATGFFPQWITLIGHDTSMYPKAKAKTPSDINEKPPNTIATICKLFSAIPELSDLFAEVFDEPSSWLIPAYDSASNPRPSHSGTTRDSTYVHFIDRSGRITQDMIPVGLWPITEMTPLDLSKGEKTYRVRVDHPGLDYWYEALPLHHSPFKTHSTLILPVYGEICEYRAVAMAILYALSIMVRYMPSTWRRIEGGDRDQYLALIKTALNVFERILPEEFLENIIGERVHTNQPGSIF